MVGECLMADVDNATPTLLFPHQHFTFRSLLATPIAHYITLGDTNFVQDLPPMAC